jgi:hypothetical protein
MADHGVCPCIDRLGVNGVTVGFRLVRVSNHKSVPKRSVGMRDTAACATVKRLAVGLEESFLSAVP